MASWSTGSMEIKLQGIRDRERAGARKGLFYGTEHVLQVARTRVPIEEATLERSGDASVDDDGLTGAVSFDTPYAVAQHERLDYVHDAGRQAKYLESAFNDSRDEVTKIIADHIRDSLDD